MSEQPTREEIERAINIVSTRTHPRAISHVLVWAARQYLASLDASAPSQPERSAPVSDSADEGSPKDGTREQRLRDAIATCKRYEYQGEALSKMEEELASLNSPPVPQEGVSPESHYEILWQHQRPDLSFKQWLINALQTEEAEVKACSHTLDEAYAERDKAKARLRNDLAPLLEENARLKQMDSEAATYVESVICMRTDFTGEPPYVGWKGLGLALTEALDERDAAQARAALSQAEKKS